jgi:hypothetical protein
MRGHIAPVCVTSADLERCEGLKSMHGIFEKTAFHFGYMNSCIVQVQSGWMLAPLRFQHMHDMITRARQETNVGKQNIQGALSVTVPSKVSV